jgi:hypothetical protein
MANWDDTWMEYNKRKISQFCYQLIDSYNTSFIIIINHFTERRLLLSNFSSISCWGYLCIELIVWNCWNRSGTGTSLVFSYDTWSISNSRCFRWSGSIKYDSDLVCLASIRSLVARLPGFGNIIKPAVISWSICVKEDLVPIV